MAGFIPMFPCILTWAGSHGLVPVARLGGELWTLEAAHSGGRVRADWAEGEEQGDHQGQHQASLGDF